MKPTLLTFSLLVSAVLLQSADPLPDRWPQFRGLGASGVGTASAKLPARFGPSESLLWKTPLPAGHGSPCMWGNRIFVTAFDTAQQALLLIAVNRADGKVLWRQTIKPPTLEAVHAVNSPASTTPVTDGESVYVYFGSYGFAAYSLDGKLRWEHPMPPSKFSFGSATSPVLAGDLLLMTRDHLPQPQLIALNRKDGSLAWQKDLAPLRFQGSEAHSTPLVVGDQVILNRPTRVAGHSLKDGSEIWWVTTTSVGTASLTEHNGIIYVAAFNMGVDGGRPPIKTPFAEALAKYDKNGDGKLSLEEAPEFDLFWYRRAGVPDNVPGAHFSLRIFFGRNDANKDGGIDEAEYDALFNRSMRGGDSNNGLMAIRPGGTGDVSSTAILWREARSVPEVASPLVYRGNVYMVTSGGILTCVDEATGKVIYRGRVQAPGAYYSSPVAAGDKIIVASGEGIVTSLEVGPELKVLANNDLGEPVFGTPALAGSQIYIRSAGHLWAFGNK